MPHHKKVVLADKELPKDWYNIVADMPHAPAPLFNPQTKQPVKPEEMAALFPLPILEQEMSAQRDIEIPKEIREIYYGWRPSPLFRASGLEKALDTPAHIYYKYEGVSPSGSHKSNTAVAQAFYNKISGTKRIATETGAGQWGSALAMAGAHFGLEIKVYMVKVSYGQKPYRRLLMETYGAQVVPSPSPDTAYGRQVLAADPQSQGSLGIAISEAVEDTVTHPDTKYALGSVLNHVALHQTVIGLETIKQLEIFGEEADIVFACHGGGSNFAGMAFPFVGRNLRNPKGKQVQCVAVEPFSCPTLTKGVYAFDYGDTAGMTPITKMYTLGHDFMPPGIHAGGLRYHGAAPLVSQLLAEGHIQARAVHQIPSFEAAVQFARTEGILPAPESSHAIRAAVDEALACKQSGQKKVIVLNVSGHGHFDLASYEKYLTGKLEDYEYPAHEIEASLHKLPKIG